MPVCTSLDCALAGVDQPASAFRPDPRAPSRPVRRCRRCCAVARERNHREGMLLLPIDPLRDWLRAVFAGPAEAANVLGIDYRTVDRLMDDAAREVKLDTVDHACLAWGISIDSLYPLGAASLPGTETVPR